MKLTILFDKRVRYVKMLRTTELDCRQFNICIFVTFLWWYFCDGMVWGIKIALFGWCWSSTIQYDSVFYYIINLLCYK